MKSYKDIRIEDTFLDRSIIYKQEEVIENCYKHFNNDIAADVFVNKYILHDNENSLRENHPYQVYERVAWALSAVEEDREKWFKIFLDLFMSTDVLPQGSPCAGAGNMFQLLSLSNCFVGTAPRDSMNGINDSIGEMSNCQKRRGGWGTDLGDLRPDGAPVKNAAKTSTGAWAWANAFSNRTRDIGQGGRRGALMLTYPIDGMDAYRWATMKNDLEYCTGANVSLKVFDAFMQAIESDSDWLLQFKPLGLKSVVKARDLYRVICESAVTSGDPGMLFWDTITNNLPLDKYEGFKTKSTNPCAELPLSELDSCRLFSINLSRFVIPRKNDIIGEQQFDFQRFETVVRIAMRMSDNLVELECLHTSEISKKTQDEQDESEMWAKITQNAQNGRRTGLGTHALADMFSLVGFQFANKKQLQAQLSFLDLVYSKFKRYAYQESVQLAIERGPFPIFDSEIEKDCKFFEKEKWLTAFDGDTNEMNYFFHRMKQFGRRNGALLTIAPTGTTSMVSFSKFCDEAGTSTGIEPVFLLTYVRRKKINDGDFNKRVDFVDSLGDKWQEYFVMHPLAKAYIQQTNPTLIEKIKKNETKIKELSKKGDEDSQLHRFELIEKLETEINDIVKDYFTTSAKCDWKNRIKMQGVIQKHIDHGVSSTINLPNSLLDYNDDGTINRDRATKIVMEFYMEAWKNGLKGQTIYVDGSKSGVQVSKDSLKKQISDAKLMGIKFDIRPDSIEETHAPIRPKQVNCDIHHITVKGEPWIVLVGIVDDKVFEVFSGKNIHNLKLPAKGIVSKVKSQNYNLLVKEYYKKNGEKVHYSVNEDEDYLSLKIDEYLSQESDESSAYLLSKSIQHGTPIWAIVDMANKMPGSIIGFTKSISRVLKKYIKAENTKFLKCAQCESNNLAFEENCFKCLDCGYSKC